MTLRAPGVVAVVLALAFVPLGAGTASAQTSAAAGSAGAPAGPSPAQSGVSGASAASSAPSAVTPAAAPASDETRAGVARAYEAAMRARRLGTLDGMTFDEFKVRVASGEELVFAGRWLEAISSLTELVESTRFAIYEGTSEGRAAVYFLGAAYAGAGVFEPARAYFRKAIAQKDAWADRAQYARKAVSRIVETAITEDEPQRGLQDLRDVPVSAPADVQGELTYLRGRAKDKEGDADGALAAYAQVQQSSRFWSQATYLSGLIQVERKKYAEAEAIFCKLAEPKRQDKSTPALADAKFFAIRDLARLALGRLAHEQYRFDDSRYYYYLVPRDSERLAEALYEAATSRYEKKDYEGARELLDDLTALRAHHRYEDEAMILGAYLDLAQCKFKDADDKLKGFIARYEPVRDAARKLAASDLRMNALLSAAKSGADAGGVDFAGVAVSPDAMRTIASLVRVDPAYAEMSRRRGVLDREVGALSATQKELESIQAALVTAGGVRPTAQDGVDVRERKARLTQEVEGVRRQLEDLEASGVAQKDTEALRTELTRLSAAASAKDPAASDVGPIGSGKDLPDLVQQDTQRTRKLSSDLTALRGSLVSAESALAKDALARLDMRLSRLLRRARLGRIESVLGKKRALEVEIGAIQNGYLPQDAVDALEPVRYLKDNEEYWPFEGDDWPDEYVGAEGLK
jgi:hypothetical protein